MQATNSLESNTCICTIPPFNSTNFNTQLIGEDPTPGRQGEVFSKQCKHCGTYYVEYFYEHISYSQSGRWFVGKISENSY